MRSYVLQRNTLLLVGESRGEKVTIIFVNFCHNSDQDFSLTLTSFRQIQENMCPKVSVKRGCLEKSVEKSVVVSRFACCITLLVVILKSAVFLCCAVSIRASEAVCSSEHEILKVLACRIAL